LGDHRDAEPGVRLGDGDGGAQAGPSSPDQYDVMSSGHEHSPPNGKARDRACGTGGLSHRPGARSRGEAAFGAAFASVVPLGRPALREEEAMQVKDVMTRGVECVRPDDTLQQAAQKMKNLDVGTLPVCDNDRLAGMLTDRDIVVRAVADGKDVRQARVRDAMSEGITYVFEDDDVDRAARLMRERQVRRVVVLNRDKRLVGIVSLGAPAVETGDDRLAGRTLEEVSEPAGKR